MCQALYLARDIQRNLVSHQGIYSKGKREKVMKYIQSDGSETQLQEQGLRTH
jgi:hypothetical protein